MAGSVPEIKRKLKRAGLYDGPEDAAVTPEFTAAVAAAQKAVGTFADGLWGPATERLVDRYIAEKGL